MGDSVREVYRNRWLGELDTDILWSIVPETKGKVARTKLILPKG